MPKKKAVKKTVKKTDNTQTIFQLHNDLHAIIAGQDLEPMNKMIFEKFQKRKLGQLSLDELREIVPEIKKAYEAERERLSKPQY